MEPPLSSNPPDPEQFFHDPPLYPNFKNKNPPMLPHILLPSMVTMNSKTLIDIFFSNMAGPNIISGNLTAPISDHLPQFLVAPNIFFNASYPISNNYERDWPRFDQENFVVDYFSVNWDNLLLSSNRSTEKIL